MLGAEERRGIRFQSCHSREKRHDRSRIPHKITSSERRTTFKPYFVPFFFFVFGRTSIFSTGPITPSRLWAWTVTSSPGDILAVAPCVAALSWKVMGFVASFGGFFTLTAIFPLAALISVPVKVTAVGTIGRTSTLSTATMASNRFWA